MRKTLMESLEEQKNTQGLYRMVFLGGTVGDTTWRDEIIQKLTIPYFNPVVEIWTEECRVKEELAKKEAEIHLYVISPKMTGSYSIAEMCASAFIERYKTVVVVFLNEDGEHKFADSQIKSNNAIIELLKDKCYCQELAWFDTLDEAANYINNKK